MKVPVLPIKTRTVKPIENERPSIKRILVTLDGSNVSKLALPVAEGLAGKLQIPITFFQMARDIYPYYGDPAQPMASQSRRLIFGLKNSVLMKSLKKKGNPAFAFLSRYWGPMPWLLELAIVLSCVLKHYLEAGIIFVLLTINTVIGYIQSRGSQRALEALKKRLAIKANILRDGKWATREARANS